MARGASEGQVQSHIFALHYRFILPVELDSYTIYLQDCLSDEVSISLYGVRVSMKAIFTAT